MVRVLVAALVAMIVSLVVGPKFIEFLRRNEFGQHIREEGPAGHVGQAGHAGRWAGCSRSRRPRSASSRSRVYTVPALTVLFVTLACGAIGFTDDFIKLTPPPLARALRAAGS